MLCQGALHDKTEPRPVDLVSLLELGSELRDPDKSTDGRSSLTAPGPYVGLGDSNRSFSGHGGGKITTLHFLQLHGCKYD